MATVMYKCIRLAANAVALCMLALTVATVFISEMNKGAFLIEKSVRMVIGTEKLIFYLGMSSFFSGMLTSTTINSKSKFTMKVYIFYGVLLMAFLFLCSLYLSMLYLDRIKSTLAENLSTGNTADLAAVIKVAFPEKKMATNDTTAILDEASQQLSSIKRLSVCLYVTSFFLTLLAVVLVIMGNRSRISKQKTAPSAQISSETIGFSPESLRKGARKLAASL